MMPYTSINRTLFTFVAAGYFAKIIHTAGFTVGSTFLQVPIKGANSKKYKFITMSLSAESTSQPSLPDVLSSQFGTTRSKAEKQALSLVEDMINAWNTQNADQWRFLLTVDCIWNDYTAWYRPIKGVDEIERQFLLQRAAFPKEQIAVDERLITTRDSRTSSVGLLFHLERENKRVPGSRRLAIVYVDSTQNKIKRIEWCREPLVPSGEAGLTVLALASTMMGSPKKAKQRNNIPQKGSLTQTPPERYFAAWNDRDMNTATAVFTEDATYDDTAFPGELVGKTEIQVHLQKCANCFPESFQFAIDEIISDKNRVLTRWHVEKDGEPLPFTSGLSFYELSGSRIRRGLDIVDGTSIKTAPLELVWQNFYEKLQTDPIRLIPFVIWLAYVYIVFFSNGILPGADALQLEARTWEEVYSLSLNFFLVAPSLGFSFSPVVHPILEGAFNWLLAWAALYFGMLSDDRRDKPSVLPLLPTVVGMQFLTSAFLLPYLATRTPETRNNISFEELSGVSQQVSENRVLGAVLGSVGAYSLLWAAVGRWSEFGGIAERWGSFLDLLSIDRVGSSFVVDLILFALFQSWLVDDDLKRRGTTEQDLKLLRWTGKYLPFFGMAVYMVLRPSFPKSNLSKDDINAS